MTTQTQTQTPAHAIPRVAGLSSQDFQRDYLFPHKPVVFTDAVKDWPAVGKWTPQFFGERYPSRQVEIDGETYAMPALMEQVAASQPGGLAVPYLRNQAMHEAFPELAGDVQPSPVYFWPNWLFGRFFPSKLDDVMRVLTTVEVFIGGAGSAFPNLHINSAHTHAFLSQVYGEKELILYAPDQTPFLYPQPHKDIAQVGDVDKVDLEKFPLFAQAVPVRVTLGPGETVFIPGGWWHTARMKTASITVAVNTANASNWPALARDVTRHQNPVVRGPLQAYLLALGQWKSLTGAGARPTG